MNKVSPLAAMKTSNKYNKMLVKCKCNAIKCKCKKHKVNPNIVRCKNISSKNKRNQQQLYRRLLLDAINEKLQLEKYLNKRLIIKLSSLTNSTTWLKVQLIKYSINRHIENLMNKIKKRHSKKLDALIFKKKMI